MSLYPSAMSDEISICRKIETEYAFTKDMHDALVKKFNEGNFILGSVYLKIK